MKNIILISFLGMFMACSAQRNTTSTIATATIQTSAECGMCKTTIEGAFTDVDGMILYKLDVPSKKLRVKYDSAKISLDQIRQIVASVGYDADDVASNGDAYDALPACCQKGGMGN